MTMVRLVYSSKKSPETSIPELGEILRVASAFNGGNDITGALLYSSEYFLQILEGDAIVVNALYTRILADPRHSQAMLLSYEPIQIRVFANWSMRLCALSEAKRQVVLKYSPSEEFNPESLSPKAAVDLARELCEVSAGTEEANGRR